MLRWSNKGPLVECLHFSTTHTHNTDTSSGLRSRPCWPRCTSGSVSLTEAVKMPKGFWEEPPTGRYCANATSLQNCSRYCRENLSWGALCWRDSAAKPPEGYARRSCSWNADSQVPWKHILSYVAYLKKHTETPSFPGCFSITLYWNSLTLGQLAEEKFYRAHLHYPHQEIKHRFGANNLITGIESKMWEWWS